MLNKYINKPIELIPILPHKQYYRDIITILIGNTLKYNPQMILIKALSYYEHNTIK